MSLLAFYFRQLTVKDDTDRLLICDGSVPFFRRFRYTDIRSFEPGRTTILDGWGIPRKPRGSWTWNLWGFDCVDIDLKNGCRIRLGTDDVEDLADFLTLRLSQIS